MTNTTILPPVVWFCPVAIWDNVNHTGSYIGGLNIVSGVDNTEHMIKLYKYVQISPVSPSVV